MNSLIHPKEVFPRPLHIEYDSYKNTDGYKIRYATLRSPREKSHVVHQSGFGGFIEYDYELMSSLSQREISITVIERCGEGGSEKIKGRGQMLPALPHETYIRDLYNWMSNVYPRISNQNIPTIMSGYCFGGLIMTAFASQYPDIADAYVLTSPLYGRHTNLKLFFKIASQPIPTMDSYSFNAHDWTWKDAEKAMKNNRYTHDIQRGMRVHYWRRDNKHLRQGGITKAGSIHLAQSVLENLNPQSLAKVQKHVTIMSATLDVIGSPDTHQTITSHIKNRNFVRMHGAKHGILNEIDLHRDKALSILTEIAQYTSRPYQRLTQKLQNVVHV